MPIDYKKKQAFVDKMIRRWGAKAKLRRIGVGDRDCMAFISDILARDSSGQILNPKSYIGWVSAKGLTIPPDWEKDSFVMLDPITDAEISDKPMTADASPLAPAGVVVYWEIKVQD